MKGQRWEGFADQRGVGGVSGAFLDEGDQRGIKMGEKRRRLVETQVS